MSWPQERYVTLLDFVQPHELLYNTQHRDYVNNTLRNQAWSEVVAQLNDHYGKSFIFTGCTQLT